MITCFKILHATLSTYGGKMVLQLFYTNQTKIKEYVSGNGAGPFPPLKSRISGTFKPQLLYFWILATITGLV